MQSENAYGMLKKTYEEITANRRFLGMAKPGQIPPEEMVRRLIFANAFVKNTAPVDSKAMSIRAVLVLVYDL